MWTRRQQFSAFAVLMFCFLLLMHKSETIREHANRASTYIPYKAWSNSYDDMSEEFGDMDYLGSVPPTMPCKGLVPITETDLLMRPHGFTVYDNLYLRNGTLYAIVETPSTFPDLKNVLARPLDQKGANLDPTPEMMQVIMPGDATNILGSRAVAIEGASFIIYDMNFLKHYYHWWGEIILGAIKIYSAMTLTAGFRGPLADPSRFIIPNVAGSSDWHDKVGIIAPLMRAAFPSASVETGDYWKDLSDTNQTFVFERAMIISRHAAHKSPLGGLWFAMISTTMEVATPPYFWEPFRQRVVRNTVGYLPSLDDKGLVTSKPKSSAPIVLYISRQNAGRRLRDEDHEGLLKSLKELEDEGVCQVQVVAMEKLSLKEQIETVGRATIMLGIHGNGLTHQIWMPATSRSTVIEIFFPQTYRHDYSMLSRNMEHAHYAVWNDTTLTYPKGQWFKGINDGRREDFHGNNIPVHGPTVARVIRERLWVPTHNSTNTSL
ncbi:hypothetical protein NLJ89_g8389 [Agrocybe chaxingu]|uniref:Glycosyltransferase 61 catalytic domain-containing protein n=1 Tax=Agrocybe chaxingu TaxID=84603 RepID=A0A9W8MUJ1_9AGAR|nr:hypothetical protein NLJ89_g8389 [Agrocybe chaxingu]